MTILNDNSKLIADRILGIRRELGLSQQELGFALEVSYQYVSALENGSRKPGMLLMKRIINLCHINGMNEVDNHYLRPDVM